MARAETDSEKCELLAVVPGSGDQADLAENSAVRGCMVIKPYGYAIWKDATYLDDMFRKQVT